MLQNVSVVFFVPYFNLVYISSVICIDNFSCSDAQNVLLFLLLFGIADGVCVAINKNGFSEQQEAEIALHGRQLLNCAI